MYFEKNDYLISFFAETEDMKKIQYVQYEKTAAEFTDLAEFIEVYPSREGNIVSERRAEYGSRNHFLIPYLERKDLLPREKTSIGNYQDVHSWNDQKNDWSFEIPQNWMNKPWCFMINSYCRDLIFKKSITDEERKEIEFNIQNIDSAISKSKTDKEYTIYKGLNNVDWLNKIEVDGTYTEKAFGSYSLEMENALKYTDLNHPILFQIELRRKSKALYIDTAEYEVLLPRNTICNIEGIEKTTLPIPLTINNQRIEETIVYNLKILEELYES